MNQFRQACCAIVGVICGITGLALMLSNYGAQGIVITLIGFIMLALSTRGEAKQIAR